MLNPPPGSNPRVLISSLQILFAPYNYLLQTPGKGIRPAFLEAFNEWLHVPEEKMEIIKTVIEMLHGGSLL